MKIPSDIGLVHGSNEAAKEPMLTSRIARITATGVSPWIGVDGALFFMAAAVAVPHLGYGQSGVVSTRAARQACDVASGAVARCLALGAGRQQFVDQVVCRFADDGLPGGVAKCAQVVFYPHRAVGRVGLHQAKGLFKVRPVADTFEEVRTLWL